LQRAYPDGSANGNIDIVYQADVERGDPSDDPDAAA
jgi:hypothetical protein